MERRSFISVLLAAAGTVLVDLPSALVPEGTQTWVWLKWVDPKIVQETDKAVAYLLGRRTDGNHYYVVVPMHVSEMFSADTLRADQENARLTLDTFLNCSCGPSGQCTDHLAMFGSESEIIPDEAQPTVEETSDAAV